MKHLKISICLLITAWTAFAQGSYPADGVLWPMDDGPDGAAVTSVTNQQGRTDLNCSKTAHEHGPFWSADVPVRFIYADDTGHVPYLTNTRSVSFDNSNGDSARALSIPGAVESLALTNDFTFECFFKIAAETVQWSRLIQVMRANTFNQYTNGAEASYAMVLQVRNAPGTMTKELTMRTDTQIPATNRWSAGFNQASSPFTVPADTWFHFAMTYTKTTHTLSLYRDGLLQNSYVLSNPFVFDGLNSPLSLGARYRGGMDLVRITDRVLRPTEFLNASADSLEREPGTTVGHWRMENTPDEPVGFLPSCVNAGFFQSILCSNGGERDNLRPTAKTNLFYSAEIAPKKILTDRPDGRPLGINTSSIRFTNMTHVVIKPTRLNVLSNFTAEVFLKMTSTNQYVVILAKRRANVVYTDREGNRTYANNIYSWEFGFDGTGKRALIRIDSVPDSDVLPINGKNWNEARQFGDTYDGLWHHCALTYDYASNTLVQYLDYKKVVEWSPAYRIPQVPGSLFIGPANDRNAGYYLDEVRLSDTVLPPEQFLRFRAPIGTTLTFQ